jgi:hypothetical protein
VSDKSNQLFKYVVGPEGTQITRKDLPKPSTRRWVVRRKAEVVLAVRGGLLTQEEACQMYDLSNEEFALWCESIDKHGMKGLRTTRIQDYRSLPH